jgi:phospholipase C
MSDEVHLEYDPQNSGVRVIVFHHETGVTQVTVRANAYRTDGPWILRLAKGQREAKDLSVIASHGWYDLTVLGDAFEYRFAGRLETGAHSFSDPAV